MRTNSIMLAAAFLGLALVLFSQEPSLAPRSGMLLLRNGNTLAGRITRLGDFYIVEQTSGTELRIRTTEVETVCADLADVYAYRKATLRGSGAAPYVALGEWCLREDLFTEAQEQLTIAEKADPKNPAVHAFSRKLSARQAAPAKTTAAKPVAIGIEEMEKKIAELPAGSLERFTQNIQPILVQRCAAGACHSSTSSTAYRLLRPQHGEHPSKRVSQRNLLATLAYVNRDVPLESALLAMAQKPHADQAIAALDKRQARQVEELSAWLKAVAIPQEEPPRSPASISADAAASQAQISADQTAQTNAAGKSGTAAAESAMNSADSPLSPSSDPFDPERFNRRKRR